MDALSKDMAMRVATEHLTYRHLVADIEADLERARGDERGAPARLAALLDDFGRHMRRHFALEEKGGLYEVYRAAGADSRLHAAQMVEEHRDFSRRMREALERVATVDGPGPELEQLAAGLHALFEDLREHERVEDGLLDRLIEGDLGAARDVTG